MEEAQTVSADSERGRPLDNPLILFMHEEDDLGWHLSLIRRAQGLTQPQLAKKAGLSRLHLVSIENHRRPALDALNKALKPLGLKTKIIFVPLQGEDTDEIIVRMMAEEVREGPL